MPSSLNCDGLLDYQGPHLQNLLRVLQYNAGACLDASDTGVGKTYTACAVARQLDLVPFIIAPKVALPTWERVAKHIGIEIEGVNVERVRGIRTAPQWADDVEREWRKLEPEFDNVFLLTFPEIEARMTPAVRGLCQQVATLNRIPLAELTSEHIRSVKKDSRLAHSDWVDEFKHGQGSYLKWRNQYGLIIFDEVHNFGGSTTLNSKCLIAAKRQHKNILALSATAADDPTQMKALGFALGLHDLKKYQNFLLAHGVKPGVWGGFKFSADKTTQRQAMSKIHAALFPRRGARLCKKDIPGFPKEQLDIKLLPAPSELMQRKASELEELDDGRPGNLAEIHSLRQMLESAQIPDTIELCQEYAQTSKVAVFVNYLDTVAEMLKILPSRGFDLERIGWITGDQFHVPIARKYQTRDATVDAFQRNLIDVLIVTHGAGGASISLHDPYTQYDRTGLFFPTYSAKHLKQAIGRLPRQGGGFVQQYLLYFAGTYQEKVAKSLLGKLDNIDILNDGLLEQILTGKI